VSPEFAARLAGCGIEWVATEKGYCMFTRGNCAAAAHRQSGVFSLGSSGLMTENGFAYLVWREGRPFLAAHGGRETAATTEQVDAIQRFSADLKAVLTP
jgi:hypothetical protein